MIIAKKHGRIIFVISQCVFLIGFLVFLFLIMQWVRKKMSNNTYGSYGLREERLNDPLGKKIKFDTLFNNLYDYWTLYHHPNQQILRNIVDF